MLARKRKGEMAVVGGTALTMNCEDKTSFIVGTESGSMFKCNITPM